MGSEGNSKAVDSLGVSGWRELSCWVVLREAVQVRYGCHGFRRQNWRVVYFPCVHELSELHFSSSVVGARGRQRPVPHSDKGIKAHGRIKSRQRGVQERESQNGVWKTQCRRLVVYLAS